MEPRLLRRGNRAAVFMLPSGEMLQWSHAFSDVETGRRWRMFTLEDMLQWSHAFSDVETRDYAADAAALDTASMEPRLLRRGNALHSA